MSLSSNRPSYEDSIAQPSEGQIYTSARRMTELRRWAYEQTSTQSTTDRRIKAATQIVAYVLGKQPEQDQPNES